MSFIWSVNGIHSLPDVPKGTTYHSAFFCDVIVSDLLEKVCVHSQRRTIKGALVHLDSVRLRNSKKSKQCLIEFRAGRMPHPPDSPDLAASEFFCLFFCFCRLRVLRSPTCRNLEISPSSPSKAELDCLTSTPKTLLLHRHNCLRDFVIPGSLVYHLSPSH
jgi:hypothetical protein